ncbi:ABC transporter ATP-binding protein [Actinomadura madurae]|uniref:ABC transporter ATP-binding protein n=1 Tax=Actinomadura madurae TaxID=1993 RepID=UPI002026E2AD|nr:ABC transporter ATP-binding protein [Actinomadura madurae]MCP9950038.1 ABC transporter ATP-binding protein [Actinomadura madurae]MCP9966799.1 ABC transporter ATP-binding protein [Actinomadura madurae]MCQ0009188.1 ABC transporter ATP-binding protein [Actinomadura madurae]MCQ0015480.1 ABC transporter ATP-binding protein [Actinomadura madurae]URM95605.1 ABC transporter ATP-binding protein [Actinomadura madurae]
MTRPLLEIEDLVVEFDGDEETVRAVDGAGYRVAPGETLGVVGESGSGKSVTAMSALGLIKPPGRVVSGRVVFDGSDLRAMPPRELRGLRGGRIAMIFQDPMTALNPVVSIGAQIREALRLHQPGMSRGAARKRAAELLELVGVPGAARRLKQYPHEFSGGMRQRAMIAMAIANDPDLLIADEPTTALDVTVQAQVLDLLRLTRRETGAATVLITHDLGVVAELADRVVVMYAGRVVEHGPVAAIFEAPRHPYTRGLLESLPTLDGDAGDLTPIPGSPPAPGEIPRGCAFAPRCPLARDRCRVERPDPTPAGTGRASACHFHHELAEEDIDGRA